MFGILGRRHWPIALDLGSDTIKMLQLRRAGSTVRVSACGRWQYPESAREDPAQRRQLVLEAVRGLLRTGGFVGREVVTALSCGELSIKNLRLPPMPPDEMRKAIQFEAKDRFGFEVSPDQIHCLHAGSVRQGSDSREEVILLAAPREVVEAHLALLGEMGLRPEHVDAEPVALFRTFERFLRRRSDEQAVSVIVDTGYSATRVVVARGRQIVFLKSIDLGGSRLNRAVAKQVGLPLPEAAELRWRIMRQAAEEEPADAEPPEGEQARTARQTVDWALHDAVRAEIDTLGKEIALCLRYCSVTFRGLRPQRITLTGGEAYDPSLRLLLREHLNLPVVIGQPLRGLDLSGVNLAGDRRATLAEWALCAGLAGRHAEIRRGSVEDEDGQQDRLSA